MLKMAGVSKIYRTSEIETCALNKIDLHIKAGEFITVKGPSGSGKTTLLNVAGLLESFEEGELLLDGDNVKGLNDDKLSALRNQKIGFIFQGFNLLPELPVFDNVDVPLRYRGFDAKERKKRIDNALEIVGLTSRRKHLPMQLSGGQQQRVAIARALAGEPRFLLADEPTGNLDSTMAKEVMELLKKINNEGTTIIMVTHDDELAAKASRSINILDGRIVDVAEAGKTNIGGHKTQSTQEADHAGL